VTSIYNILFFLKKQTTDSIRFKAIISLAIITPIGFYSKFYQGIYAEWVNNLSGGAFYEIFWSLLFFLIFPKHPKIIAFWVLIATCCLEFLQLWHPPMLEWLRSFFIGRIILGTTFNWWDFAFYILGSAISWLWMMRLAK